MCDPMNPLQPVSAMFTFRSSLFDSSECEPLRRYFNSDSTCTFVGVRTILRASGVGSHLGNS